MARELSEMLGSREPQIVNGTEILDKFVGRSPSLQEQPTLEEREESSKLTTTAQHRIRAWALVGAPGHQLNLWQELVDDGGCNQDIWQFQASYC